MCHYLLKPLKECTARGRGDIFFSKSNKRCAKKTLGLQSEPQMLCPSCRLCLERGPDIYQRGGEVAHFERKRR